MSPKRILLPCVGLCAAAFTSSCIVNTSGKLDSIGKTHEGYYFDATRPTTCLFKQNGKYYVKAPIVSFPATSNAWRPEAASSDDPAPIRYSYISNVSSWGYHEIFTTDTGSINPSRGNFHPILHAGGNWIPAAEFEQKPYTVIGKEGGIQTSRAGDRLDVDAIRVTETHRSAGNILRLPLVLIAGCAIDLPGNIIIGPFMLDSNDDDDDDDDGFLDSLIDDALDNHCKKHHQHNKKSHRHGKKH